MTSSSSSTVKWTDPRVRRTNHPVLLQKITLLRDKNTNAREFRSLVREITFYLGYESTTDLQSQDKDIQTPLGEFTGSILSEKIAIIPILRAGLGMTEAMMDLIPSASVHHIGMYRQASNLKPILYYNNLPAQSSFDQAVILEPMIATSGTISAAIKLVKKHKAHNIKVVALIASSAGLKQLLEDHPDITIHVGAIDNTLSAEGMIVPGLGDCGDRLYLTPLGATGDTDSAPALKKQKIDE